MANQLPVGPARMRASDHDREQVVAFIRGHWSHGRLSDDELERRVGLALQARTLGDFRELCADLPPPPRSRSERMGRRGGYLLRLMRTPGGAAVFVVAGLFGLAVLGAAATEKESSERRPVAAAPIDTPPADPPPDDVPSPEPKITRGRIGQPLVDGGITLQVRNVRTRRSVPQRPDRGGGSLTPGRNRKFIVAEILYVNRSSTPADPFCGSGASELDVGAGEPIRPIDALYDIAGNDGICSDGAAEGAAVTNRLVFRVPTGDVPRRLDVWDGDEPGDSLGDTRIRIRL